MTPVPQKGVGWMILVTIGTVAFLLFLICVEFSRWDSPKNDQTEREALAERKA